MLAIGSIIGLISAAAFFLDSYLVTKSDKVNPDNPFKIRRRVNEAFRTVVLLNSIMSVFFYGVCAI